MKNKFKPGDIKVFVKVVEDIDTAKFEDGQVHPFYGTFALARDAEWTSRLFVLEMIEEGEEGIGTYVNVDHLTPALVGDEVQFTAVLEKVEKNDVLCEIEAKVGDRLIAKIETGQKILTTERLDYLEAKYRNGKEEGEGE